MEIDSICEPVTATHSDLGGSRFEDANLSGVLFDHVTLQDATIRNANPTGSFRIDGVLVSDMLAAKEVVRKQPRHIVIPAKAGIHRRLLDSRFRGNDGRFDYLRSIRLFHDES